MVPAESIPTELIRWMEVPRQPNVFSLGNFARQVTFASQQARAFNLIWALFRANRLSTGGRVAVIGAGLGGMTAAIAALAKGCYVDLYEQASQPCPIQRGNDIRFIHPNILSWPEEGSETAQTDFPYLNWTAASVRGVIKQIDLQWKRQVKNNRNLRRFFNYKVNRLYVSSAKSGPQQPWLTANRVVDGRAAGDETSDGMTPGYLESSYDCVILAVGFGEEKSVAGVPFLSYWENDSLHQETGRGRRSILLSGCGDGGLIDALRLRLRNFDHADFVRRFLSVAARSTNLIQDLKTVDDDLRQYAATPDISLRFKARYDAIPVPEQVDGYFREERRADTTVTLNSPAPGPLSFRASLLNRYATYLAMRFADLHYLSGRIVAERAESGNYQITLQREDINLLETRPFDLVIIRHGPENVIRQLIPDSAVSELQSWWEKNEDITTRPHWRQDDNGQAHGFFLVPKSETAPPAKEEIDLALSTFDSAYRELNDEDAESVAVGTYQGKAGFIVTLKPGVKPRQSRFYAGVLVQYISPPSSPMTSTPTSTQPGRPSVPTGVRPLPIGAGIYNYDAQERLTQKSTNVIGEPTSPDFPAPPAPRQDYSAAGAGTLGCFATDKHGDIYLISTGYVLSPDSAGVSGDKIFLEGQSPPEHRAVATLVSCAPILRDSAEEVPNQRNTNVGVAIARLEHDVHPDYSPLAPAWRLTGIGSAAESDVVAKVGRTTGLTTGIVIDDNVPVSITVTNSERELVDNCIMIISNDNNFAFSLQGDTGAIILRDDGLAVGLLIARSAGSPENPGITVACSLERALQSLALHSLELKLLPSDERPDKLPQHLSGGSALTTSKKTGKKRAIKRSSKKGVRKQ